MTAKSSSRPIGALAKTSEYQVAYWCPVLMIEQTWKVNAFNEECAETAFRDYFPYAKVIRVQKAERKAE